MSEAVDEKAARYLVEGRLKVVSVTPYRVEASVRGTGETAYRTVREAGKGSSCTCPALGRRCCHRLALEWVT